jgi:hypothetical protein
MRRIAFVRVSTDGMTSSAVAVGVGHRLPRVMPIRLSTAARLASDGVPLLFRRRVAGDDAGKRSA